MMRSRDGALRGLDRRDGVRIASRIVKGVPIAQHALRLRDAGRDGVRFRQRREQGCILELLRMLQGGLRFELTEAGLDAVADAGEGRRREQLVPGFDVGIDRHDADAFTPQKTREHRHG